MRELGLVRYSARDTYVPHMYLKRWLISFSAGQACLLASVSGMLLAGRLGGNAAAIRIIAVALLITGLTLISGYFWTPMHRSLKKRVRELGGLACTSCAHALPSPETGRCPECNTRYTHSLLREVWARAFGFNYEGNEIAPRSRSLMRAWALSRAEAVELAGRDEPRA